MLIHRQQDARLPGLAAPVNVSLLGQDALVWYGPQFLRLAGATSRVGSNSLGAQRPGLPGLGMSWTRSGGAGVDFGVFQHITGQAMSALVLAAPVASANRKVAFSQRTSGSSAAQWWLALNSDGALGALSGSISLVGRNTTATVGAAGAASQFDGGLHCWTLSRGAVSGDAFVFRDGEAQTVSPNTPTTGTIYVNTQITKIGNIGDYATDGVFVCDDPIFAVVVWPRTISAELGQYLSKAILHRPELLFAPRLFSMPASAAAPAAPTLSDLQAVSVTSSSVQATYDYAF